MRVLESTIGEYPSLDRCYQTIYPALICMHGGTSETSVVRCAVLAIFKDKVLALTAKDKSEGNTMNSIQNHVFVKAADGQGLFSDLLADVRLMMKRHAVFNATVAELSALSVRELADVGMGRGDIRDVARKAAAAI